MEIFGVKNLTFSYPQADFSALKNVDLTVNEGDFLVIFGKSGCGKSTLLRQLKTVLAPHGQKSGEIRFKGVTLDEVPDREQAAQIGYVLQNPESQIVTDKVWHELAFGLESLGCANEVVRLRVAEMAGYFGMEEWFDKNTAELSGGQKQLLNLAAVMAMQPEVIVLDEPTSQLDPIAASEFLSALGKINRDLGITVIVTEHRLEEAFVYANRVVVMEKGEVLVDSTPQQVAERLGQTEHDMLWALPTPIRVFMEVPNTLACPISINEGRQWLKKLLPAPTVTAVTEQAPPTQLAPIAIELKDVWFKYKKEGGDVLKNISLKVREGDIHCILGGNGTGKTTAINIISKILKPNRGKVLIQSKQIEKYVETELYGHLLGVLPQNPQSLFVKNTVEEDLWEMFPENTDRTGEALRQFEETVTFFLLENYLKTHPHDLSGGEQQRLAFAKVMLLNPEIILLDEPTKGLDNSFKKTLGELLLQLKARGKTILMVSHDVEFCARYSDMCSFFFGGEVISTGSPRQFFAGNHFYTTSANKMARQIFENTITAEEVAALCNRNL